MLMNFMILYEKYVNDYSINFKLKLIFLHKPDLPSTISNSMLRLDRKQKRSRKIVNIVNTNSKVFIVSIFLIEISVLQETQVINDGKCEPTDKKSSCEYEKDPHPRQVQDGYEEVGE